MCCPRTGNKQCKEVREGVTVDRKCDSYLRNVKGIREVCQLTERCDGYERRVRRSVS